jgi:S-adenosylmethionine:tRNA ribosyltransferase-isomerase
MKLRDFAYVLPEAMIAQQPVRPRDRARLMVVDRGQQTIRHDIFANLGNYLPADTTIVLNDSKVVPARILARRATGGEVEIFLLKKLSDGYSFEVMMRPLRRIKPGETIHLNGNGLYAEVTDKDNRIVRFNKKDIASYLKRFGHIPLPPYIRRPDVVSDKKDYQTVYARHPGSVASPTAGLHFTKGLLNRLKRQGHSLQKVTLHINYATFKPVEEEDITRHRMHEEEYSVTNRTFDALQKAKSEGRKIVAVGTTSCRVLETIACVGNGRDRSLRGITNKFIYPGCRFRMTDILVTNFHLPCSTLLMLVSAFGGTDLIKRAYREAVEQNYRFYSYGDAMVILR